MNTYTRNEIKEMATKAAEVEIYHFVSQDRYIRGIHTDNVRDMEAGIDDLPETFDGMVELMDEDEYNGTLLANSSTNTDFGDWYGNKDAKVLVVVLSYESWASNA